MSKEIGSIHFIGEVQQITEKFSKREFVIYQPGQFDNYCLFELQGNRIGDIDMFKIGDLVEVEYSLSAKPYTDKNGIARFFQAAKAYRVQLHGTQPVKLAAQPVSQQAQQVTQQTQQVNQEQPVQTHPAKGDDLPF